MILAAKALPAALTVDEMSDEAEAVTALLACFFLGAVFFVERDFLTIRFFLFAFLALALDLVARLST